MILRSRSASLLAFLLLVAPTLAPCFGASPFEITHRGAGKRGFRLSARCNGGSGQSLGTVRVFQRSLFDRIGGSVSPTAMQVGVEDDRLVAVATQYPANRQAYQVVVGDATDLDDVKLFPGVVIKMTKRSFIHPWLATLDAQDETGSHRFDGKLLSLPEVTARLISNMRAPEPFDPESTRDVLVSLLETSWENTPAADFSEDYFGTEDDEVYLARMRTYYVTPVKEALATLPASAREEMSSVHGRVVEAARKAHQALLERLEYDRVNGADSGHPNRLIRQRVMPIVIGELDEISAALEKR